MFAPKMYGVCLRYAKDQDTAQDYLQEGFIRVFIEPMICVYCDLLHMVFVRVFFCRI
jgi:hypothetical protein